MAETLGIASQSIIVRVLVLTCRFREVSRIEKHRLKTPPGRLTENAIPRLRRGIYEPQSHAPSFI